MADEKKSFFGSVKSGLANAFKPMDAAADDNVARGRKEFGNQLEQDKSKGASYAKEKFKKGFFDSK